MCSQVSKDRAVRHKGEQPGSVPEVNREWHPELRIPKPYGGADCQVACEQEVRLV